MKWWNYECKNKSHPLWVTLYIKTNVEKVKSWTHPVKKARGWFFMRWIQDLWFFLIQFKGIVDLFLVMVTMCVFSYKWAISNECSKQIKGTINVNPSDTSLKEWYVRFTTVPLKSLSDQIWILYPCFATLANVVVSLEKRLVLFLLHKQWRNYYY